jgi:hypothetical protein
MSYLSGSQILMDFSRYTNRKAASHLNKKEASSQKALGMVRILKPAGFSGPLVSACAQLFLYFLALSPPHLAPILSFPRKRYKFNFASVLRNQILFIKQATSTKEAMPKFEKL